MRKTNSESLKVNVELQFRICYLFVSDVLRIQSWNLVQTSMGTAARSKGVFVSGHGWEKDLLP